ncbi:unnamed protein product [Ambrosiozyma monospora]|uniref:Unnamed protein product n=1 Tax=Ambrosiozyma monospora TaxID=43982 RepID=A0ACB5SSW8_AMBMO|nr:unnamed protein product [Ambrosiozyma monospora]
MTNTHSIKKDTAIQVASQLTREIQDFISQIVVLKYLKFPNFEDTRKALPKHNPSLGDALLSLMSLIRCSDPILDHAVCLTLPKLSFDLEFQYSYFYQEFAQFVLSKSTKMKSFSTNAGLTSPYTKSVIEFIFDRIKTEFYHTEAGEEIDIHDTVFEKCTTLGNTSRTIETVCSSGLLTGSNRINTLVLGVNASLDRVSILNQFTESIQNWFNVDPVKKYSKSLILKLSFDLHSNDSEAIFLQCISEIDAFLESTQNFNVKFSISSYMFKESGGDILNGLNTLLSRWHKKFNGGLRFIASMTEEFLCGTELYQLLHSMPNLKITQLW